LLWGDTVYGKQERAGRRGSDEARDGESRYDDRALIVASLPRGVRVTYPSPTRKGSWTSLSVLRSMRKVIAIASMPMGRPWVMRSSRIFRSSGQSPRSSIANCFATSPACSCSIRGLPETSAWSRARSRSLRASRGTPRAQRAIAAAASGLIEVPSRGAARSRTLASSSHV